MKPHETYIPALTTDVPMSPYPSEESTGCQATRCAATTATLLAPQQVNTGLEEWRFTGHRYARANKDLCDSDPALLAPVEPLGFLGSWIFDGAF